MNSIIAYTDGSACVKGEKLGGFGVYIIDGQKEFFYRKGFLNTKTGRMELRAMIFCLQQIQDKSKRVEIRSDSEYTVKCVSDGRLWRWKQTNWAGLKNVDLLKQYIEEIDKFRIRPKIIHIKGHTEKDDIHSLGNQICDELASYKTQLSYERDLE